MLIKQIPISCIMEQQIRYDDLGKLMKQTSFVDKNMWENLPKK